MNKKLILNIFGILSFFFLWESLPRIGLLDAHFFPPLSAALSVIYEDAVSGSLWFAIENSFLHYGIGLGGAMLVAIPLGILIGRVELVENLFLPIEELVRPIPPIAWIPAAILWFGLTPMAAGFVIFIGTFFPLLINTYDGVKGVNRQDIEAAVTLGVDNEFMMVRKVIVPSASPSIFTGIKISVAAGWMCLVAAELIGAGNAGLGLSLWNYYGYQNMAGVFGYMFILGILGLIMYYLITKYESIVLNWRKGVVA